MINVDVLENGTISVFEKTVSDSVKFEKIRFTFPESWDGFSKTVVFKNEETVVEVLLNTNSAYCTGEDECLVPFEVIKPPFFTVSVFGLEGDRVATTVRGEIEVLESGYEQGDSPEEPTQSIYAQILDETQKAVRTAQSVRDDADSGKFKGDKGEKGETGEKGEKGEKGDSGKDALTDQTYNPRSKNAQSGQAVAEALLSIQTDENGSSIIVDQTFNPESENAQSGKAVDEAIKIQALNSKLAEALKEQNKSGNFTVWLGTQAEYDAISEKVKDCFYIITDDNARNEIIDETNELVDNARNEIIDETKRSLGDYVTEQGKSGAFTYRKWNSGIAEIWGNKTKTASSWNPSSLFSEGGIYTVVNEPFPFEFTKVNSVVANCTISNELAVAYSVCDECLVNQRIAVNAHANCTGEQTFKTAVYVLGRWK